MTEGRSILRSLLVAGITLCVLTALGARLGSLHLGENEQYWNLVTSQQRIVEDSLFGRGKILDRDGQPLAYERSAKHIYISPYDIHQSGKTLEIAQKLIAIPGVDPTVVRKKMSMIHRKHELIKRFVPTTDAQALIDEKYWGVKFEDAKIREYTFNENMAHVLGFSNWKGIGSAGIEQELDVYLRGTRGYMEGRKDNRRREIYQYRKLSIDSQQGADVVLTLDRNIQIMVEKALDEMVSAHQAKGAWAIVQDVRTGEILGMASRPTFDPMHFVGVDKENLRNQAISTVFEPGSTMKVLSLAAALDVGVVKADTMIDCENGVWHYGGWPLKDHHAYDRLSVADVLKKSSNIGTAKITMLLGEDRFERALRDFGIGSKTGIDLPGEERGIFHPRRQWSKISITRIPMGQGVSVTALQMLNAVSAVANDGYLMKPMIVKKILHRNGKTILEYEPEILGKPISEDTARLMQHLMTRVTDKDGTGRRARLEGYPVAGKTGTAQKPEAGGYSNKRHIASFVGFVPSDDPRISIIVVADEPTPIHSGGYVAAPTWKKIAQEALPYLDVPPRFQPSGTALTQEGRADRRI